MAMNSQRRSKSWGIAAGIAMAIALSATTHAADKVRDEFHKSYPLTADGRVSLQNINGAVKIVGWDKNEIQIDAVKTADTKEKLDEARIEIDAQPSLLKIKTEYPRDRENYNNPATVEYTLQVPRHARLDSIRAVNGAVSVEGVQGLINVSSVNGSVTGKALTGEVKLSSVNGRVLADVAQLGGSNPIEMDAVNGAVELTLPSDSNAELTASTVHGGISANGFDIPVQHQRWTGGSNLQAKLGTGMTRVKLSTVNGSIRLQRASDGKPLTKVTNLLPEDKGRYD
jgi:DUF4097 and DUF4098 domain-containing protein YvlB